MVLDCVVCATFQQESNISPFVLVLVVCNVQDQLFLNSPAFLLNTRVQMVMPALSALLSDPAREVLGNTCPFLRPFLRY